ncbi:MAG: hypothetical protein NDI63_10220 [Pseudobdellovibrio sp.]|nr:hypothetical protein [Pseudobdellovibrio sp.]
MSSSKKAKIVTLANPSHHCTRRVFGWVSHWAPPTEVLSGAFFDPKGEVSIDLSESQPVESNLITTYSKLRDEKKIGFATSTVDRVNTHLAAHTETATAKVYHSPTNRNSMHGHVSPINTNHEREILAEAFDLTTVPLQHVKEPVKAPATPTNNLPAVIKKSPFEAICKDSPIVIFRPQSGIILRRNNKKNNR